MSAFAACKVVVRHLEVFVDLQRTGVINKMVGVVALRFASVRGIVEREVTICALQLAFGVNVP